MDDALRGTAEAFLGRDARVATFAIHEADGSLEIVLTPAPTWVAAERAAAHAALETRILKQWQMVYDRSYRWDREVRPPNFDAWVSGFTGEAISNERMQIWLDDALSLMRSVPHERVIEIGCGVGLVAAALAPGGRTYFGLDLSSEAIASLAAWVATRPELSHVRLAQCAAHDLDGLSELVPGGGDLAVMNSVVQYFPDAPYLERVLTAVVTRLALGGAVFLGDLRAAALLPMRATNVAAARAEAGATVAKVRADAVAVLGLARELAIDPAYLVGLGTALPRLGAITFSLKPAAADHELSGYRYDAILRLDVPEEQPAPVVPGGTLADILARLHEERPEAVAFCNLANARLARDAALSRAVADAAPETPLAALDIAADPAAIEPSALAHATAARGYAVELRFTSGSPEGRFDALLRRPGVAARWPAPPHVAMPTNDPLGDDLASRLRRDLQASLDAALGGRGKAKVVLGSAPTP